MFFNYKTSSKPVVVLAVYLCKFHRMNNNVDRQAFINCLPYKLIHIKCVKYLVFINYYISTILFQAPSRGHILILRA